MLVHKQTEKVFSGDRNNRKPQSHLFEYPIIDHTKTYSQRPEGQRGSPSAKQLFIVAYSYYPHDIEGYNDWKEKVGNFGYRVYIEKCKYGTMVSHMVLVAESEVNLEQAIEYIHQNPHPELPVIFG